MGRNDGTDLMYSCQVMQTDKQNGWDKDINTRRPTIF